MSSLHLLSRSPASGLLAQARKTMTPGDALLLLEDGVYHLRQPRELAELAESASIYFLAPDLRARGLGQELPAGAAVLDYDGLVSLCVSHDRTLSWF